MKSIDGKIFVAKVVKGKKLGSKIGYPTINLELGEGDKIGMSSGVYVCDVQCGTKFFLGLMSYGPKPTFGEKKYSVEIHLLDFEGEIYGQKVKVKVYNRLRGIRKFSSVEDLRKQIEADVDAVRKVFNN